MKKSFQVILLVILTTFMLSSCQSVKPYQRVYLNDYFMKMDKKSIRMFGEKVQAYREGSAGGGTGKSSGGCGCN